MNPNDGAIQQLRRSAVILLPVQEIRTLHFDRETHWSPLGASTAVVERFSLGKIDDIPATVMKALGPVKVIRIHEEHLIKKAYLIKRFPTRHPKPSIQYIHVCC